MPYIQRQNSFVSSFQSESLLSLRLKVLKEISDLFIAIRDVEQSLSARIEQPIISEVLFSCVLELFGKFKVSME